MKKKTCKIQCWEFRGRINVTWYPQQQVTSMTHFQTLNVKDRNTHKKLNANYQYNDKICQDIKEW